MNLSRRSLFRMAPAAALVPMVPATVPARATQWTLYDYAFGENIPIGMLWQDTSECPGVLRMFDGARWVNIDGLKAGAVERSPGHVAAERGLVRQASDGISSLRSAHADHLAPCSDAGASSIADADSASPNGAAGAPYRRGQRDTVNVTRGVGSHSQASDARDPAKFSEIGIDGAALAARRGRAVDVGSDASHAHQHGEVPFREAVQPVPVRGNVVHR